MASQQLQLHQEAVRVCISEALVARIESRDLIGVLVNDVDTEADADEILEALDHSGFVVMAKGSCAHD